MTEKRYLEEFKIEAFKQVTDRGYSVLDDVMWYIRKVEANRA